MAQQTFSYSGATTNTTGTPFAQVTFDLDGSEFSSYLSGNPTPIPNTGRPLLLRSFTLNLSTSSGGDGFLVAQDTFANDGSYNRRRLIDVGTLSGSKTAIMDYAFFATGSDAQAWIGFKKNNNGTTVRYQRGSSSGDTVYLVYNGDSSPTVTHSSNALNSSGIVWTSPSAPNGLTATAEGSDVSVSWTAPSDDGGTPVNNYTIFYSPDGTAWERSSTTGTSATLTDLSIDTEYQIIVAAHNIVTDYHNSERGLNATSAGVIVGAGATVSVTTQTPYEAVSISGLASSRTVRVGDSGGDNFSGSNTYGDYDLEGTNFAITAGNQDLFSLSNLTATGGRLNWSIPEGTSSQTNTVTVTAYGPYEDGDTATDSTIFYIRQRLPVWTDDTISLTAKKGEYYSDSVSADYVNSWDDGNLPTSGLEFSNGSIYGTLTSYGEVTFTITPRNSDNEAPSDGSRTFTIQVADEDLQWSDQIILNNITVQGDTTYTEQVSVIPGPDVTYSVTPGFSLPAGLELDSSTGVLSANPTTGITAEPNIYTFRIRATNGTGATLDTGDLNLSVEAAGGYVKVRVGGQWVEGTMRVRSGGQWVEGTAKIRSSGVWNDSFSS